MLQSFAPWKSAFNGAIHNSIYQCFSFAHCFISVVCFCPRPSGIRKPYDARSNQSHRDGVE
jgi:hypothetical protein